MDILLRLRRPAIGLGVALLALLVMYPFVRNVNDDPRSSLDRLMDGSADKPFVYRQLLPKAIVVVDALVPKPLSASIEAQLVSSRATAWMFRDMQIPQALAFEASLALVASFIALLVYAGFLFALGRALFPAVPGLPVVAMVLGLAAIPPNTEYAYFYDFPVLAFSAALLYYLARARFVAYLVTFALACLNKETSVLFVILFVLAARSRVPRQRFLLLLAAQLWIYGVLRLWQVWAYGDNEGRSIQLHWPAIADYGVERFAAVLFLAALVCTSFSEKPAILKQGLWLLVPFEALFLIGGGRAPGEFRVFYELHPVLVLSAAHGLLSLVRLSQRPPAGPAPGIAPG